MSDLYQLGRRLTEIGYQGMGAGELGISNSEFLVLRDLFMNGQSSISETVGRTNLAQSRVSTCVQALVKKGWVTTGADPEDGRRTLAQVTPEVKAMGDARRAQPAEDALSVVLADVDPAERAGLAHALERLHELLVPANLVVRVEAGADADLLA